MAYTLWHAVTETGIMPEVEEQANKTLFGQFERKLANIRNSEIRQQVRNNAVNDEQRRAFLVSFVGESESTDDVGGQYRELFNELSNELCVHGVFGLFVKHDKYVIPNASLRDSESIARFELVGKIMGMAMRARIQIPLDNLTPLVWKFLTHDTFSEDDDVQQSEDDDGEIRLRQRETLTQLKAIHSGFNKIVPAEIVRIFSWKELRDEICGVADVPVDQLRRVAVYEGFDGEKDPSLKFF